MRRGRCYDFAAVRHRHRQRPLPDVRGLAGVVGWPREFHRKTPPDPGSGRSRRAWPRGCIAGSGTSTGRTSGSSLADFANSATSSAGMSPSPPGKTPGVVPVPVFRSRPVRRSRSLRWTLRMHRQFRRLRPRQARILLRAGRRYSLLPDLAHDLAEAGKEAGAGVLAGIAIIGGVIAGGGVASSGQIAR